MDETHFQVLLFLQLKDFVVMELNQKPLTAVKTCHLQSCEISGHLTHILTMAGQIKAPHSMGGLVKMEIH